LFSILTFNAGLLDVRVLGLSVHAPLPAVDARLAGLIEALSVVPADIVCLQEIFHGRQRRRLRAALGETYPHIITAPPPPVRLSGDVAVLSRFPISAARHVRFRRAMTEERLFTDRGFLVLEIDLPHLGSKRLIVPHTSAGGLFRHPESATAEAIRADQVGQILDAAAGSPIPVILAGDFNLGPEASADLYRRVLDAGFIDAFAAAGGMGATWTPDNLLVARGGEAHLPKQRIDHVFLDRSAADVLRPISPEITFEKPVIPCEGERLPLSDHYGIRLAFEPAAAG
jgi:endonuclease/exonuclease/phosphatase family metal-dependent hydrolase